MGGVYRHPPHPVQRPKVTPLLQGFLIAADSRLITHSPLLGTSSVARVSDSRWDFRSTESGNSSVSRSTESRWFFESQEIGNSSVSKPSESRITFSSTQTGNSSVSKLAQAALDFRSYLSALGSITVQIFAEAKLFFGSLFKGDATVTSLAESSPAFEASNLAIDLNWGYRSFALRDIQYFSSSWISDKSFRIIDLEMTKTGVRIDPVVIGDDFTVRRVYTGLPTGIEIDTAWFTVKVSSSDPDPGLIQKVITPTEGVNGHIVVSNTSEGFLEMFFDPTKAETSLASTSIDYVYDVQVKTTTSKIHTLEKGNISFITGVTSAST